MKRFGMGILMFSIGLSLLQAAPPPLSRSGDDFEPDLSENIDESAPKTPHLSAAVDIQYIPIAYKNYVWSGYNQTSNEVGSGLHVGVEWLPLTRFGKLGLGAGIGYYLIRNVGLGNGSHASLNTFPLETFLSYRFDYVPNQIFVPFGKIGADYTWIGQTAGPRGGPTNYTGWDWSAGLELCLNRIDSKAARDLSDSVGVQNSYFLIEYLKSSYLGKQTGPNLTHDEYRIGLRFEM